MLDYALAQVGKPYRFFSAGPAAFDCSGLTLAAYARVGVTLIHHSASQARQGTPVDFYSQPIQPGDLVFVSTNGSGVINHVGIAINDTSWVQARRPGVGVRVTAMPRRQRDPRSPPVPFRHLTSLWQSERMKGRQ